MENIKEKIQDKVIDLIALGAGGRLIAFKPENSDKDLIVEKKGDYKKESVSFNIYEKEQLENMKDINPEKNFYLLFTHFDFVKQDIEDELIIVSSVDSKKILLSKKDFVRFLISLFTWSL